MAARNLHRFGAVGDVLSTALLRFAFLFLFGHGLVYDRGYIHFSRGEGWERWKTNRHRQIS
jgi:hypothetical protein